ncbi:MAG TPA: hypothetical protein VGB73_20575 [Pyrinomonadaceae bacterium]
MKSFIAALFVCLLLVLPNVVSGQTRSRRSSTPRRRASSSSTQLESVQANSGRIRLADQIKNLTRFLYLYGRFSKDLELTGTQAEASEVANRTRAALADNLRNIQAGLDELERQFRMTPGLERHYRKLAGVAQRAGEAEARVSANQLDQAGRTLVEIVNQLTDVLVEM